MRDTLTFLVPGSIEALTGGSRYDRRIVEALRAEGHEVDVVELPFQPERGLGAAQPATQEAARAVFARLERGARVVIDGLLLAVAGAALAEEQTRLVLLALVHHPLADEAEHTRAAARFLPGEAATLRLVAGIVVTSRATRRRLVELAGDDNELATLAHSARVVEPGVERPRSTPTSLRDASAPSFVTLGALIPRKGHLELLAALAGLSELEWTLTAIGRHDQDRAHAMQVVRTARALGLARRVDFVGAVPDSERDRLLAAADVLVHPARYEGYGMAVAEALVHGLPVVTTTGGALAETLPPGAGLAVPPADVPALRRALRRVLLDPALRRSLARRARAAGETLPTWADSAREFASALRDLSAHSTRAGKERP